MNKDRDTAIIIDSLLIGYGTGSYQRVLTSPLFGSSEGGELIAVIGRNGIGKSTLLRTISGLQNPIGGNLKLYGKDISEYSRMSLAKTAGYISTEIVRADNMTVFEMVALGRFPHTNWIGRIDGESKMMINKSLEKTGLKDFINRNISELSDGERQKAMIARLLAQDTDLMMMDEPTAFLDLPAKYEIVNLMHELTREGKTIIFSTHDFSIALNHADKIWLMLDKGICEGAPEDLMLNDTLKHLFNSTVIRLNHRDGTLSFLKKARKKIALSGKGIIRNWTERALIRAGYDVEEIKGELNVIPPDSEDERWKLDESGLKEYFTTLYDLIRRLQR